MSAGPITLSAIALRDQSCTLFLIVLLWQDCNTELNLTGTHSTLLCNADLKMQVCNQFVKAIFCPVILIEKLSDCIQLCQLFVYSCELAYFLLLTKWQHINNNYVGDTVIHVFAQILADLNNGVYQRQLCTVYSVHQGLIYLLLELPAQHCHLKHPPYKKN